MTEPYFTRFILAILGKIWTQRALSNISNTRDSVSLGYPNTEKRVENMTRNGAFLTTFEVFGQPMKHCLRYLISSQSKQKLRSKRRDKIVKIYAN